MRKGHSLGCDHKGFVRFHKSKQTMLSFLHLRIEISAIFSSYSLVQRKKSDVPFISLVNGKTNCLIINCWSLAQFIILSSCRITSNRLCTLSRKSETWKLCENCGERDSSQIMPIENTRKRKCRSHLIA